MTLRPYPLVAVLMLLASCQERPNVRHTSSMFGQEEDTVTTADEMIYDLPDIIDGGELLVATISGPKTYFEYRGEEFGEMYQLANHFAQSQGLRLRVTLVGDTTQLLDLLTKGTVDIAMLEIAGHDRDFRHCGAFACDTLTTPSAQRKASLWPSWLVRRECTALAAALDAWYSPSLRTTLCVATAEATRQESGYKRRRELPMMGVGGKDKNALSPYDHAFRQYAPHSGFDWRLLVSIAWQESGFDPEAESYAGAKGIMQLMPRTAARYGLEGDAIWNPERNIEAGCKHIGRLQQAFRDITDPYERIHYILAAYNGGEGHTKDAMTLAKAEGQDPMKWSQVSPYLLRLSDPTYYTRPDVKHGYMRGTETATYVDRIMARWNEYNATGRGFDIHSTPTPGNSHNRKQRLVVPSEMR